MSSVLVDARSNLSTKTSSRPTTPTVKNQKRVVSVSAEPPARVASNSRMSSSPSRSKSPDPISERECQAVRESTRSERVHIPSELRAGAEPADISPEPIRHCRPALSPIPRSDDGGRPSQRSCRRCARRSHPRPMRGGNSEGSCIVSLYKRFPTSGTGAGAESAIAIRPRWSASPRCRRPAC